MSSLPTTKKNTPKYVTRNHVNYFYYIEHIATNIKANLIICNSQGYLSIRFNWNGWLRLSFWQNAFKIILYSVIKIGIAFPIVIMSSCNLNLQQNRVRFGIALCRRSEWIGSIWVSLNDHLEQIESSIIWAWGKEDNSEVRMVSCYVSLSPSSSPPTPQSPLLFLFISSSFPTHHQLQPPHHQKLPPPFLFSPPTIPYICMDSCFPLKPKFLLSAILFFKRSTWIMGNTQVEMVPSQTLNFFFNQKMISPDHMLTTTTKQWLHERNSKHNCIKI